MKKIMKSIIAIFAFIVFIALQSSTNVKATGEEETVTISINKNGDVYEGIQYTSSRDIEFALTINEEVRPTLDNYYKVCEVVRNDTCDSTKFTKLSLASSNEGLFQIYSANDGNKKIRFTFYTNYNTNEVYAELDKEITLDTEGPTITLNGNNVVNLKQGERYIEAGATCEDNSGFATECTVEISKNTIDMNKKGYQYIRYTASDKLGNTTIVDRKIVVEIVEKKSNNTYWIFAGVGLFILAGALGYIVLKNKEKKKNQGVL